ncbi:DUF6157 family protein [Niabella defluvii]|nr:DUF6157 family protein [Niabella sp. I65]
MKQHTTNYFDTLIEVAEDCPVAAAEVPASKGDVKTVAQLQYELIAKHPINLLQMMYCSRYTPGVTILPHQNTKLPGRHFFSKGQPCLRASPLTKRYGFGVHADKDGKIALYGVETSKYAQLLKDDAVKKVKAMRTSKK